MPVRMEDDGGTSLLKGWVTPDHLHGLLRGKSIQVFPLRIVVINLFPQEKCLIQDCRNQQAYRIFTTFDPSGCVNPGSDKKNKVGYGKFAAEKVRAGLIRFPGNTGILKDSLYPRSRSRT